MLLDPHDGDPKWFQVEISTTVSLALDEGAASVREPVASRV
jgi:hypothetical protein